MKTDKFWVPDIQCVILHHKITHNYITYDITFNVQKTHGWSPTVRADLDLTLS